MLVNHFSWYCVAGCGAHMLGLHAIASFMLLFSPAILAFYALVHQETLQRTFITYKVPATQPKQALPEWHTELIRALLKARDNMTPVTCLIECNDSLRPFLNQGTPIHAPLSQPLLNTLLASPHYDAHGLIYINAQGYIVGMNMAWSEHGKTKHGTTEEQIRTCTAQTDSMLICADTKSRSFHVTHDGKQEEALSSESALRLLAHRSTCAKRGCRQ